MATFSKRSVVIGKDTADVGQRFCSEIERRILESEGCFTLGLSGGSMPKILGPAVKRMSKVNWAKVKFIFCDERLVSFEDDDSTYKAYKAAFDGVEGIAEANFVLIDPDLGVKEAAADYEAKLRALPGQPGQGPLAFDLLLLGMGPDGHTCSLFPGHGLLGETRVAVAPIDDSPKPPPNRVTLTYPTLNAAKAAFVLAAGDGKKDIVKEVLEEGRDYPIGRVKPVNGEVVWFLDEAAAAKLKK